MPPDERTTKSAERCDLHPGSPSVARCDGCGRPMCLACAVPVRGQVLGAECLVQALGPDVPAAEPSSGAGAEGRWNAVVGAAFAVALVATLLPWTRFGEGSGPFGAWGRSPRWSLLAAVAAAVGLALWMVWRRMPGYPRRAWDAALAGLAVLVVAGAVLAALRPPSFTHAAFAPWIAATAGTVAFLASLLRRREGTKGAPEPI